MSENDEVVEKIQNEIKELEEKLTVTSAKRKTLERMMELINKEVADTESMIQQTRAGLGLPPTASVDNNGVTTSGASNGSRKDSIKHSTGPSAAAVAAATNAGGEERRTGICATIDPFMPLIEDIPSLRVMPLDPSLIDVPVRTISGPIDPYVITNPLCEVVDTIVAARTVSTYPMITSSGTKVKKRKKYIKVFTNHLLLKHKCIFSFKQKYIYLFILLFASDVCLYNILYILLTK